jgi:hypothetical protein
MIIKRRRLDSVEAVTAKLDVLARQSHVQPGCYDESAAHSMNEFDALKWTSLCAQRRALVARECQPALEHSLLPSPFQLIYRSTYFSVSTGHRMNPRLENKTGRLSELAA